MSHCRIAIWNRIAFTVAWPGCEDGPEWRVSFFCGILQHWCTHRHDAKTPGDHRCTALSSHADQRCEFKNHPCLLNSEWKLNGTHARHGWKIDKCLSPAAKRPGRIVLGLAAASAPVCIFKFGTWKTRTRTLCVHLFQFRLRVAATRAV